MSADQTAMRHLLSWDQVHHDALALADALRSRGPFAGVVAVSRGGLAVTAVVATRLDIRLVETVCIASYDGVVRSRAHVLKTPAAAVVGHGENWLVVDDLVDSGTTARLVRTLMPKAHLAALYAKPAGRPHIDTFLRTIDQEVWIVFPWERDGRE